MTKSIADQIDALQRMTTSELVERFAELHGYPCRTRHRAYLIRKIAWRIQANAEGVLSDGRTSPAHKQQSECRDEEHVHHVTPSSVMPSPAR